MAGIPLVSGPQDPSQLNASIDALITQINAYLTGGSAITVPVSAASTATAIAAGAGQVSLNSTTRAAGTTGRYTIAAPSAGLTMALKNLSTSAASVTGLFERSKVKITFAKSTASLATAKLPGVLLRGLSTSAWALIAAYGPMTVSS